MALMNQIFRTFCRRTSLHGWQFLGGLNGKGLKETWQKIYWLFAVMLSLIFGISYMMFHIQEYRDSMPITSLDNVTIPLADIYFPSVAVCNINQVRQSYFEELGVDLRKEFVDQVYGKYIEGKVLNETKLFTENSEEEQTILKRLEERTKDDQDHPLGWDTHQKCQDMLLDSTWNGSTWDDSHLEWDMEMDYGICCYYSPQLNTTQMNIEKQQNNLDWGKLYRNMPKGAPMGKDNGYSLLLDIEVFDYGYRNEISEGVKMELVKHFEVPMMRQTGFHMSPGTENQIAVNSIQMSTSYKAIKRFPPDKRNCYTENESLLSHLSSKVGYLYSLNNCLFEAIIKHIIDNCKCYPRKFIYMSNHYQQDLGLQNCYGEGLECMNNKIKQLGRFNYVSNNGSYRKCRPNCEDQKNSITITSSIYPNGRAFVQRNEFCTLCKSLIQKCNNSKKVPLENVYPGLCGLLEPLSNIDLNQTCSKQEWPLLRKMLYNCTSNHCLIEEMVIKYARENLVLANIFMKSPFVTRFLKDEKEGLTAYVAKSGGLLGLAMGFSVVSCFEIIYYILLGLSMGKSKTRSHSKSMKAKFKNRIIPGMS